jgi:hypothetical protein
MRPTLALRWRGPMSDQSATLDIVVTATGLALIGEVDAHTAEGCGSTSTRCPATGSDVGDDRLDDVPHR